MTGGLVLRDVRRTFRGSNGDPGILRSVRPHLRKGEIVALVGPPDPESRLRRATIDPTPRGASMKPAEGGAVTAVPNARALHRTGRERDARGLLKMRAS